MLLDLYAWLLLCVGELLGLDVRLLLCVWELLDVWVLGTVCCRLEASEFESCGLLALSHSCIRGIVSRIYLQGLRRFGL